MMTLPTSQRVKKSKEWVILGVSAVLTAFFLFFIDEGYYDLRWMEKAGNWIAFAVYVLVLWGGQLAFSRLALKRYHGAGKTLWSIVGGTAATLALVFTVYYTVLT